MKPNQQTDEEVARELYEIFGGKYAQGLPFSGVRGSIQKQWIECAKHVNQRYREAWKEGMMQACEIVQGFSDQHWSEDAQVAASAIEAEINRSLGEK